MSPSDLPVGPLRIAANGRSLGWAAAPFHRLQAMHLLRVLSEDPAFRLELYVPPVVDLGGVLADARVPVVAPTTDLARALFDHWWFPRLAARSRADVLLLLHPTAPLRSSAPSAVFCENPRLREGEGRWLHALARSGMHGAAAVLHPADLAAADPGPTWLGLPPMVPSGFEPGPVGADEETRTRLGLPPEYVLAAEEGMAALELLLAAWTWVEGSLGDLYTLVVAAPGPEVSDQVQTAARRLGLGETARAWTIDDAAWPAVLRGAAAVLHGGEVGNAPLLRWALASGVVVAGRRTPVAESILGPAGYLSPASDARSLGAACLTLLVEEAVADGLRQKGLARAAAFGSSEAAAAWTEAIRTIATDARRRRG